MLIAQLYLLVKYQATKAKADKWNDIKLRTLFTKKEIFNKVMGQLTEWKIYLQLLIWQGIKAKNEKNSFICKLCLNKSKIN